MTRRSLLAFSFSAIPLRAQPPRRRTGVSIQADKFHINGRPTYQGRTFDGLNIEGLLMNSRMIQGIFDDANPATVTRWRYPDTAKWDAERNTREFIAAMTEWRRHGLLSFTIGLQGGSPEGYSKLQPWRNSAFESDGTLKPDFMDRLERILDKADELGMVAMVNYFYFGQDEHFESDKAVQHACHEASMWILTRGYRNVMVDLVNECDNRAYQMESVKAANAANLIELTKSYNHEGRRLLVGTSFNGGVVPTDAVVKASDFVLLHGNGVKDPARIVEMVRLVRALPSYRPMPVLFNEDDHFDFDQPSNNMRKALESYASWGYFDPGKNDYSDGYQSVPVNWGLNTPRKKAFFALRKAGDRGMTALRGAVAGCGFFAQFHLDGWRRTEGVEIVAACDLDLPRAQAAAPTAYTTLDDLLAHEAVDFVDIATRPETHLPLVEIAARRGVAVICQKPMAPTLTEAERMVDIARAAGIRLMIHENWRWQPWYRVVHRSILAGDIGQPVTYRFRIRKRDGFGNSPYPAQPYFREMPRLLIYETLVHPIDTARFLLAI